MSVGNVVSIALLLPSALLGGLLANRDALAPPLAAAAAASPFAAAYEALVVNEFHQSTVNFWFTAAINSTVFPPAVPVTGDQARALPRCRGSAADRS